MSASLERALANAGKRYADGHVVKNSASKNGAVTNDAAMHGQRTSEGQVCMASYKDLL